MDKIGNINVVVKNGNIAEETADCIIVPEFNTCASYGGVGYAMKVAGMSAGLEEYDKKVHVRPLQLGEMLMTDSGKPGVKLAHVATADAKAENQFSIVEDAIYKTLVAANVQKLQHIAMPELGTGIIGALTQEQSALAIFSAVYKFTTENPNASIKTISLVVYNASIEPALKVLKTKAYVKDSRGQTGKKKFSIADWLFGMRNHGNDVRK